MGFKDRRSCPHLCRLASEYIRKYEGFEDDIYAFFENEPDADSLYVKLVEEFERCILSYFAFHWTHGDVLISQVSRHVKIFYTVKYCVLSLNFLPSPYTLKLAILIFTFLKIGGTSLSV